MRYEVASEESEVPAPAAVTKVCIPASKEKGSIETVFVRVAFPDS